MILSGLLRYYDPCKTHFSPEMAVNILSWSLPYQDSSGSTVARGVRQSPEDSEPLSQGEASDGGAGSQEDPALSDKPTWVLFWDLLFIQRH